MAKLVPGSEKAVRFAGVVTISTVVLSILWVGLPFRGLGNARVNAGIGPLYNNVGVQLYKSQGDITIGSEDTQIFSGSLPAPTSLQSDMCVTGEVELTYFGMNSGRVNIKVGLWNNDSSHPSTEENVHVEPDDSPVVVPIQSCAFNEHPMEGTKYFANVYAQTALTGLVAKFKDTTGTSDASWVNITINYTFK